LEFSKRNMEFSNKGPYLWLLTRIEYLDSLNNTFFDFFIGFWHSNVGDNSGKR